MESHRRLPQFSLRTLFAELTLWCIVAGAVKALLESESPRRVEWTVYAVCAGLFCSVLPITCRLDVLSVWGGLIFIWIVDVGDGKIHGPLCLFWYYLLKYEGWVGFLTETSVLFHLVYLLAAAAFLVMSLMARSRSARNFLAIVGFTCLLIAWLTIMSFWMSWLKILTSLPLLLFCALRVVSTFIPAPKISSPHSP